jgi:hypothetical protein
MEGRMTANKNLKRRVRSRAAKTGESYTTALRYFRPTPEGDVMEEPQLQRVMKPQFGFAVSVPADWVERPPDPMRGPQVARWAGPGEVRRELVVFRLFAGQAGSTPREVAESVISSLQELGFASFEITDGDVAAHPGARLNCVKTTGKRIWSVRQYYAVADDQVLVFGLGTATQNVDADLFDVIASKFECIESENRLAFGPPPERYTDRARRVLRNARSRAREDFGQDWFGSEHLLLGLIKEESGLAAEVIRDSGITEQQVIGRIEAERRPAEVELIHDGRTGEVEQLITRLIPEQAFRLGFSYVGTEHILLAILAQRDGRARTMLMALGADEQMLREQLVATLTDQIAARIRIRGS